MRLHLSSVNLGPDPQALPDLIGPTGSRVVAVILNAADTRLPEDRARSDVRLLETLRLVGLEPRILDLRRFFETPITEAAFDGVGAVCVKGGDVHVLNAALRTSGADTVLAKLLREDALVWSGYSAGACVLSSDLDVYLDHDGYSLVTDTPGYEGVSFGGPGLSILPFWIAPHYDPASPSGYVDRLSGLSRPCVALRDDEALSWDGDRYVRLDGAGRYPVHDLPSPITSPAAV